MKREFVRLVFLVMIMFGAGAVMNTASAQVYVTVRPQWHHIERPAPPAPGYVWIDEDWQPRGGAYVAVGGHWILPPHRGWIWIPGHWAHERRGDYWVGGHWRRP